MKININEKNVLESNSYSIKYEGDHNIVLMNDGAFWGGSPMHGKMTDVNVWSRVLTDDEIHHWEECQSDQGGDLVNWETARFNLTAGITQTVEDKEKYICFHKTSGKIYKTIKSKETFDGSVKYCNTIGAAVAKAEDANSLKEMEESFKKSCTYSDQFYTGFTDRAENRKWQNYNNEQELTFTNWADGFPKNYTQHDCIMNNKGRRQSLIRLLIISGKV